MPLKFKKDDDGNLVLNDAGDPIYVDDDGKDSDLDVNSLLSNLDKVNSESASRKREIAKLKEQAAKLEGIDPEKARADRAKVKELEKQELEKKGEYEKLLAQQSEELTTQHTTELETLTGKMTDLEKDRDSVKKELAAVRIDQAIADAANGIGSVRSGAASFIRDAARKTWQLDENNKPVALDADGNQIMGADKAPITPEEWVRGLQKETPYLWEEGKGGGAKNEDKPGPGAGKVLTQQEWMDKTSKATAEERQKLVRDKAAGKIKISG